jgi:hypothetical protein
MAHKTKDSRKKKKETLQKFPSEERQHFSLQSPEYKAPILGMGAKEINPQFLPSTLNILLL